MHTIARASSFASLPSSSNALAYPYYHHPPSFRPSNQSRSAPSTPSEQLPPPIMPNLKPSVEVAPPAASTSKPSPPSPRARSCLKSPTKEFPTRPEPAEPEVQIISPTTGRHTPGANSNRRKPNMKLERLPSSAIARIQLAEGVEPHAQGVKDASSGARGKCKERVPTPYVKSDKTGWLSDGEE